MQRLRRRRAGWDDRNIVFAFGCSYVVLPLSACVQTIHLPCSLTCGRAHPFCFLFMIWIRSEIVFVDEFQWKSQNIVYSLRIHCISVELFIGHRLLVYEHRQIFENPLIPNFMGGDASVLETCKQTKNIILIT